MSENAIPSAKHHFKTLWKRLMGPSLLLQIAVMVLFFILLTLTVNTFSATLRSLFALVFLDNRSRPFSYDPAPPLNFNPYPEEEWQIAEADFRRMKILERSITVTASAEEMQIVFRLVIPKDDVRTQKFSRILNREQQALLTRALFGNLEIDNSPLAERNFQLSRWEVDPAANTLT